MGFVNKRNGNTMRPVAEDRDFLVVPTLLLHKDVEAVVDVVVIEIVFAIFDDCDGVDDATVVADDDDDWVGWATIVWFKWFTVDVGAATAEVDGDSDDDCGASFSLNDINWPAEAYCTGTLLRRRLEIETFSSD